MTGVSSARSETGHRRHLQSSATENRRAASPLRLLLHGESGRGLALLVGILSVDRLAIGRNGHAVHPNDFPVPLVGLLNRVVPDPLQRNHRVAWVSLDRIVLTVKLRVIAVAVRV